MAGTGHRPNKLLGYGAEAEHKLKSFAIDHLCARAETGLVVVSGLALGWDTALALGAKELGLPLIAAVPFKGQEEAWPLHSQLIYQLLLDYATQVTYVCEPGYAPWKMQARNRWMVDRAEKMLALWDGSHGGTANCITYAAQKRVPVENCWSDFKLMHRSP